MILKQRTRIFALLVFTCLVFQSGAPAVLARSVSGNLTPGRPQTKYAEKHDLSTALRTMVSVESRPGQQDASIEISPRLTLPKSERILAPRTDFTDPVLQTSPAIAQSPAPQFNFEGVNNVNGVLPPDTNGDIGPNHYVQWVNLSLEIWQIDRATQTATPVFGPLAGNSIWQGFGGDCEATNDGDPIVLYDHLADRWLISQFAINGPYYECIAISQTPDPTGAWYRYAFKISNTKMNDYPKLGVWPDGYYMTVNQFTGGSSWGGAAAVVFERDKMLSGQAARMVYFDLYDVNPDFSGMLPSDLDGTPPDAGAPNIFAEVDDSSVIGPTDAMRLWEFHVDWANTNNSTFGISGEPNLILPVAALQPRSAGIPQPGSGVALDNLADRLMHRLQYRNFGSYATLVTNHTVDVGGRAAVRWYELRNSGSGWSIYQQGSYAGDSSDGLHRWMGSVAMDSAGNIAAGYSASSSSSYPSIRYTTRLASDPAGTLPQGEVILMAGSGSQTHTAARWGDYSMMSVDPLDDCTFWYTSEYLATTSNSGWRTRIGSFVFPSCSSSGSGTLEGHVTDKASGLNLQNARVEAGGFSAVTGSDGYYRIDNLPTGLYTVTAGIYGYQSLTVKNIQITNHTTRTQNFALTALPSATITGTISDGSGQGWPLYARLRINGNGFIQTVFTDPRSGQYTAQVVAGLEHTLTAEATYPGYNPKTMSFTPTLAQHTLNMTLTVDTAACNALGYVSNSGCSPQTGGLLAGNVYDDNTALPLIGAAVTSRVVPSETARTVTTPDDPALDDGFFVLFSSSTGNTAFEGTALRYGPLVQTPNIGSGKTTAQNFHLPAGRLVATPDSVKVSLPATNTLTYTVTLSNTGGYPAYYAITKVNAPATTLTPTGPYASTVRRVSPKRLSALTASSVYTYTPPTTNVLPAGSVLRSWDSGLTSPWGIGMNAYAGDLWVSSTAAGGGDDQLHRYSMDGIPSGQSIDTPSQTGGFSADLAYNPITRTFWQISVGPQACLFETDPQTLSRTGAQVCPAFNHSQRGLAFNPLNQSYYAGSWTSGIIYHFDQQGTILDSVNTDLNIAGLAFNPATGHLFVTSNANLGFDVYVLDALNQYAILGGFDIPGLDDFQQAGLDMDCNGHLWIANQATGAILEVDSGESGVCAWMEIPWLTVTPISATVLTKQALALSLGFNPAKAQVGLNRAQIVISPDTPYGPLTIPVELDVQKFYNFSAGPLSQTSSGDPGTTIQYSLYITNTGNAPDMYTLSIAGNQWTTTFPASYGPLLAGVQGIVSLQVQIPSTVQAGQKDTAMITIRSANNSSLSSLLTLVTTPKTTTPGKLFLPFIRR